MTDESVNAPPTSGAPGDPKEEHHSGKAGDGATADTKSDTIWHHHGKWSTGVAVSIAAISVLGAIASWRIETHAGAAAGFDQSAISASVSHNRLVVDSRVEAQQFYDQFLRYERLSDEAKQLAPTPAGCLAHPDSVLSYNAQVVCQMEQAIFNGGNDAYVASNHRTYNINALTNDLILENGFELDDHSTPYTTGAATERHAENRLLVLTLLLVLSLALLTTAHLARRRKDLIRTAGPAWVLMTVSAILLVVWEI